jgi:manganese transport protein
VINPHFAGRESILLAVGILGATIMPHVIFLHSALTGNRISAHNPQQMKTLFKFELMDVVLAMGIAGCINAAMLIMAAQTFNAADMHNVDVIEKAFLTLRPLLGPLSAVIFAVSLLASGLSSSTVGTMAGSIIMQGFLRRHIPVWVRRLVTMVPALIVIILGVNPTRALIMSQVVLSFGLPFALWPLLQFTGRADLMGVLTNNKLTRLGAGAVACVIVALNVYLLLSLFKGGL